MRIQPVVFAWKQVDVVDGDGVATRVPAMVPHPRYHNVAARQFEEGGEYTLVPVEERSMASHNQYFASLHEYWLNLPEQVSARWPSEYHFRPWLLIETGFFVEKEFDLTTDKHAQTLATFIRTEQPYARITMRGTKVIVRVAESQSLRAMRKDRFEESKKAVLDLAASFVGVSPAEMRRHAGRSA